MALSVEILKEREGYSVAHLEVREAFASLCDSWLLTGAGTGTASRVTAQGAVELGFSTNPLVPLLAQPYVWWLADSKRCFFWGLLTGPVSPGPLFVSLYK